MFYVLQCIFIYKVLPGLDSGADCGLSSGVSFRVFVAVLVAFAKCLRLIQISRPSE